MKPVLKLKVQTKNERGEKNQRVKLFSIQKEGNLSATRVYKWRAEEEAEDKRVLSVI